MKRLVITSTYPRHIEFVKTLERYYEIEHVFCEHKNQNNVQFSKLESKFFKNNFEDIKSKTTNIKCGEINSDNLKEKILKINPDIILTFGCSLLKEKIFDIPKLGCVNIHTGIVQMFRGVDSCYWAIYNDQPQAIGVTVHYINKTIDAGNVLIQSRTKNLDPSDTPYSVFLKTCKTGFELLSDNLVKIEKQNIKSQPLSKKGDLYLKKHMTQNVMNAVNNMCSNTISRYNNLKEHYDKRITLIC